MNPYAPKCPCAGVWEIWAVPRPAGRVIGKMTLPFRSVS